MKFYRHNPKYNYFKILVDNNLTGVYSSFSVQFFKNGKFHNSKNADYINSNNNKIFSLNGKRYGDHKDFTKQSWRRFIKLKAFL